MKKRLVLSLILPSLLILGCGSGGDKKNEVKQSVESALKIGEVVYNAPQDIDFNNKTRLTLKRGKKIYNKILKTNSNIQKETSACNTSGTYDFEQQSDGSMTITYNDCIDYNANTGLYEYTYGIITMSGDGEKFSFSNYSYIPDYYNNYGTGDYYKDVKISIHLENYITEMTIDGTYEEYKDGTPIETMVYNNLIIKENNQTNSFYFKGGFSDKIRCFNENHIYETDNNDWLIPSNTNSNYYQSGTIFVDATQYKYHGDMVTVRKGEKVGEFRQQELIDELNKKRNGEDCNI